MTSHPGLPTSPVNTRSQRPAGSRSARTLIRVAQNALRAGRLGRSSTMDLQRLYGVAFSTLDGEVVTGHSVVRRRMLLMLIDAHRTRPDRSAAEIAWVQERLAPEVEMRLVWPSGARDQALAISFVDRRQMLLDARGDYRRLVSPTGKRVSVLVDPVLGRIEQVTADSPLFAIRHGMDGVDERGSDRTMDLGDVYR